MSKPTTIAGTVRSFFLAVMRNEILEAQDQAERLVRAEMFDAELNEHLTAAYASLTAARIRAEQIIEEA